MSIFLEAPGYSPGGADGRGWNRLSLNAHVGQRAHQCALRPMSWSTLVEARRSSRLASWGNYGRCSMQESHDCGACPRLTSSPRVLDSFTDRVLVRLHEREAPGLGGRVWDEPWVMNRPDLGWGERGDRWTWEELCRLQGWTVGPRYSDEYGGGFWLIRSPSASTQEETKGGKTDD